MNGHLHRRIPNRMTSLSASITIILLVAIAAPTTAFARTLVDPFTLTPPPPAGASVCYQDGQGTICDIAFSYPPVVNDPSGIICGTTELLNSYAHDVVAKRFYNSDSLLTVRRFRDDYAGTFINPLTGASVRFLVGQIVTNDLATPGDLHSGTETITGLETRVYLPGGRTVITDVGRLIVDPASGDLVSETGQHPFDRYFVFGDPTALQPICSALGLG